MLIRPAEAARLLGISRSKTYALLASGGLPGAIRVGSSLRISRAALETWITEQAANQGDAA